MANRKEQLRGTVLEYEGEQFRVTDFRDRSVTGTTEATLEPENPQNDRLPLNMDLTALAEKTSKGEIVEGAPDPRRVNQDRSQYARRQDSARDAELTTDPFEYASDPDSLDFPGVDTGPMFREENPNFDGDSFVEDVLDL